MNIDFHVHGILSKRVKFDPILFMESIEYAKQNSIDAIVLCEHYNAYDFLSVHKYLEDNFLYKDDRYLVNNISIFCGIEVSVENNAHVILLGSRHSIIKIYNYLLTYINTNTHIKLNELLDLADKYQCLKIGSHPYRKGHKLYKNSIDLLTRFDGFDLNAKDIYRNGLNDTLIKLTDLSKLTKVNIVTGSDSHYPIQLGSIITKLDYPCETIENLKQCIIQQNYSIEISPTLDLKVYTSKIMKHYLLSRDQI